MDDTDKKYNRLIAEHEQLLRELIQERNLVHSILKTSNNLIFCMDKEARITVFNDSLERFTGYKRDEVLGKRWPDIFLPEKFHSFKFEDFGEWVRQHPADTYEGPLTIRSGEIKTILWTNSAIISPDSDEITAIAIGQDVTERKKAEESLRKSEGRYELATAAARVGVWEWDIKTNEFYLDPNVKAILGYRDDEIPNDLEKWTEYVHPDDRGPVMEAAQAHLDGKIPEYVFEHRMIHKDGSIRWIFVRGKAIRDDNGQVIRMVGTDTDITERKKMERTLRETERRFRELTELLPQTIYELDGDANIIFTNRFGLEFIGYTQEDIDNGLNILQLFEQEHVEMVKTNFEKRLRGETVEGNEYILVSKDGRRHPVASYSSPIIRRGKAVGLRGVLLDISRHKKIEGELKKFKTISDKANYGTAITDLDGNLLYVNDCFAKMHGLNAGEIIGRNLSIFHNESQMLRVNQLNEILRKTGSFSTEKVWHTRKNGTVFPTLMNASVIKDDNGNSLFLSATAIDITEQNRLEKERADNEEKFRALLNASTESIVLLDKNLKVLTANETAARRLGYEKVKDLIGLDEVSLPQGSMPESVRRVRIGQIKKVIKTGRPARQEDERLGYYFDTNIHPIFDSNGEVIQVAIFARDITERKKAENALKDSEIRYRTLFENAVDAIFLENENQEIIDVNRQACKLVGYSRDELLKMKTVDLQPSDVLKQPKLEVYSNPEKTIESPVEKMIKHRDGSLIPAEFTITSFNVRGQTLFLSIIREITERKKAEKKLLEQEKVLSDILEDTLSGYWDWNIPENTEYFSPAYKKMLGYEDHELPNSGETWEELIFQDDRPGVLETLDRHIKSGGDEPYYNEARYRHKNGSTVWVICAGRVIEWADDGSPIRMVGCHIDITERKHAESREKARLSLLNGLRQTWDINSCLSLGCRAIYDAELFKRAVLTLHNENRDITNIGFIGLDKEIVLAAQQSPAPDDELTRNMTKEEYRISKSFFIPSEANLPIKETARYISEEKSAADLTSGWRADDELFVPIMGDNKKYEGWLSVDSPFNGKRPTRETAEILEEIVEIVTQKIREIRILDKLHKGHEELQKKNVALREILGHIEEEKIAIKRQMAENIDKVLMPSIKKLGRPDGSVSKYHLDIIGDSLRELAESSGGLSRVYSKLAPREVEVCNLIKHGATTKQIAEELFVAVGTVKRHRESIRKKLGLKNKDINLATYLKNL